MAPIVTSERMAQAGLTTPEAAARVANALDVACRCYGITTGLRVSAFLAQCAVESAGFRRTVECLNYSAHRLQEIWPSRFDPARAQAYAHQRERIGSYVYGGRLGNGPEATGDGFRYRGRGFIQVTGKDNYRALAQELGVDVVADPDLVAGPDLAALSAAWFWDTAKLSPLADRGEIDAISRKVNGGTHGLAERRAYYEKALRVFGSIA